MSYLRVIPRDLFNEADLLKCCGRLWIALDETAGHAAVLDYAEGAEGEAFDVRQDPSSGDISVANVVLTVAGAPRRLYRPLNSRQRWPLWCADEDGGAEMRVFADDGTLSDEFLALILGARNAPSAG
jgi:hypothetical protein